MLASEGIKRVELSRNEFTKRVWQWKEKYIFLSNCLSFPQSVFSIIRQDSMLALIYYNYLQLIETS